MILLLVDIYEVLFDHIPELNVRLVLLELLSQLLNLVEADVEILLGLFSLLLNLLLAIKFILHLLYFTFEFLVFLVPF